MVVLKPWLKPCAEVWLSVPPLVAKRNFQGREQRKEEILTPKYPARLSIVFLGTSGHRKELEFVMGDCGGCWLEELLDEGVIWATPSWVLLSLEQAGCFARFHFIHNPFHFQCSELSL